MLPVIRRPCVIRPVGLLQRCSKCAFWWWHSICWRSGAAIGLDPSGTLYADLSTATAATINAIRTAFQVQKLLERDARGGTRYTEIIRSHFGVVSPDSRLQRPEYLGGSSVPVNIAPVAQTSASAISGSATPQGNLSAIGTLLSKSGFTQSFTEHGVVIGLANIRADLNYQQGMRRMWSRRTRYDFFIFLRLLIWVNRLFCRKKFL